MLNLLSPRAHAFLDYAIVAIMFAAPSMFGFANTVAAACYVVGVAHMTMTLCTAFPGGLWKAIPFPIHGIIELVAACSLLALPYIFHFDEFIIARNYFMVMGFTTMLVWLITNYHGEGAGISGVTSRTGYREAQKPEVHR